MSTITCRGTGEEVFTGKLHTKTYSPETWLIEGWCHFLFHCDSAKENKVFVNLPTEAWKEENKGECTLLKTTVSILVILFILT